MKFHRIKLIYTFLQKYLEHIIQLMQIERFVIVEVM